MNRKKSFLDPSETKLFSRGLAPLLRLVRSEGVYLWDGAGKRYIDGSSGPICVNLGYHIEEIWKAALKQLEVLPFAHSFHYYVDVVVKCAERLADFTPQNLTRVFFCSGGSEATEAAAKMARQYHVERGEGSKYKVVARWQSYHGNTLGALSMSGNIRRRKLYEPMLLDFPHIPPAYCYRCWFGKTLDSCDLDCARFLETTIKAVGSEYVSSFIAEPVVGATLGTAPAPEEYFKVIREICDRYNVLFIADEVMTGFGRTGRRFALEHYGVEPDIMALAKGLSSGYIPLGATIASEKVFEAFKHPFFHGHTYSGHPVACAAGLAVIEYIERHKLVERSAVMGRYMLKSLQDLYDLEIVGDVRGLGLFAGIEFVADKRSKDPFTPKKKVHLRVYEACLRNGLLIYPGFGTVDGVRGDHIQVAPPLVVTRSQIDEIVDILLQSIGEVETQLRG